MLIMVYCACKWSWCAQRNLFIHTLDTHLKVKCSSQLGELLKMIWCLWNSILVSKQRAHANWRTKSNRGPHLLRQKRRSQHLLNINRFHCFGFDLSRFGHSWLCNCRKWNGLKVLHLWRSGGFLLHESPLRICNRGSTLGKNSTFLCCQYDWHQCSLT